MEITNSFLIVFQCSKCLDILFNQVEEFKFPNSDNQSNSISQDQQQKYSLQYPLNGNIYLKNISNIGNDYFKSDLYCSTCNQWVSDIQLFKKEISLIQNSNFIAQCFPLSNKKEDSYKEDKLFDFDTFIQEDLQIEQEIQQKLDYTQNLKQNPFFEVKNLNKKLERFIITERKNYQIMEESLYKLEEVTTNCISMTEQIVIKGQNLVKLNEGAKNSIILS